MSSWKILLIINLFLSLLSSICFLIICINSIDNNYIGLKKEDVNLLDIKFSKFDKKEEYYVSMPKFIESLKNDYVLIKIL